MTNDPNNGVSGSDQGRYSPHPGVASERQRLKRFYREVGIERRGDGYAVVLDGRTVRTPARRELALPTEALADAVASEWRAQDEFIEPAGMPLTRIVNSGLDGVTGREAAVRADVVKYASSDLLCYAAEGPAELAKRQATAWGPIHRWAAEALGIALKQAAGVMPVEQDAETLAVVAAELERFEALPLAAMHVMTTLTGSALLMLAVVYGRITAADAWGLAHIDEDYQIEQWGEDREAADLRAARWREMEAAAMTLSLSKS